MIDIATGEERDVEMTAAQEKAAKGGKKGGKARAAVLTPAERSRSPARSPITGRVTLR
jgi:hypothetical protein